MTSKLIPASVLLLTFFSPCRGAESLYAGKPLAFWLKELKSDDPLIREEALLVLSDAAPANRSATSAILKLTNDKDARLRAISLTALRRALADPKLVRRAAQDALEDDDPLVPNPAVRDTVLQAIQRIEGPAENSKTPSGN